MLVVNCFNCDRVVGRLTSGSTLVRGVKMFCPDCAPLTGKRKHSTPTYRDATFKSNEILDTFNGIFGIK